MRPVNIAGFLDHPAAEDPARAALILDDGAVCTYGELKAEVDAWAATLAARGITSGQRIGLVDWGGVRSIAVTFAAAHLGAAAAHINPLLTPTELGELTALSECATMIVGEQGASTDVISAPGWSGPPPPRAAGGDTEALVLFTS